ncbi:ribonuclease 1-like [Humulus lupulus]|uniref:ribonuclease 1-like n=1 Tax=Humulus lupulus TaxID=3486 RepID=UPI002B412524|nr:ribonuclease 1-like [Humulus lupulus]
MKSYSFILFKLLVLLGHLSLATACACYDFFYFVQTWPGSFPFQKNEAEENFGIHGLWPMRNDGSYPSDCCNDELDMTTIQELKEKLDKEWPALSSLTNEAFWNHEWKKHGTCSKKELGRFKYFDTCLRLKDQTNILKKLELKNIIANGSEYKKNDIEKALRQGDAIPQLKCNNAAGYVQLEEVMFCVSKKKRKLIHCPIKIEETNITGEIKIPCTKDIKFPPYTQKKPPNNENIIISIILSGKVYVVLAVLMFYIIIRLYRTPRTQDSRSNKKIN